MRVNKTALLVSCLSLLFFAAACEKPEPEKKPAVVAAPAVQEAVEMQVDVDEAAADIGEEEPVEVLDENEEAVVTEEGGEEASQGETAPSGETPEQQPAQEPPSVEQPVQELPPVEQKN